ncbi:hypothetical protein EVAR_3511_1 [Eumeta japonica]|uniref:Uncharacterized protein n=1 Tax=Eumeta variegata TaxID=151549 RepID=A0A4C1YSU8_EUMVA|nr:hypothetical protein EVAR_3511_1 [Eumeta japonica]
MANYHELSERSRVKMERAGLLGDDNPKCVFDTESIIFVDEMNKPTKYDEVSIDEDRLAECERRAAAERAAPTFGD